MANLKEFVETNLPGLQWFPTSSSTLALFIAHLSDNNLSPATISSTISPVSFFHKLYGYEDPAMHFIIRRIIAGAHKLRPSQDTRQPIDLELLHKLARSTPYVTQSVYLAAMLHSMYLLMFHAFLRIGEVTNSPNTLLLHNIDISSSKLHVKFTSFKHHSGPPHTITINQSNSPFCPVSSLLNFLKLRSNVPGPLFSLPSNQPLTRSQFSSFFQFSLQWAGLPNPQIKPHSFRIGAATHAASLGCTEQQIQKMGRWKSNAFKKYIRCPSFTSPFQ